VFLVSSAGLIGFRAEFLISRDHCELRRDETVVYTDSMAGNSHTRWTGHEYDDDDIRCVPDSRVQQRV